MKYKQFKVTEIVYNKSEHMKCNEVWMVCSDDTIRTPRGNLSILKWQNYEKDLGESVEYHPMYSLDEYVNNGNLVTTGKRPVRINTKLSGYSFEISGKLLFNDKSHEIQSALFFHQLTKMPEINNQYSGNIWWQIDLHSRPNGSIFYWRNSLVTISVIGHYELDQYGNPEVFESDGIM